MKPSASPLTIIDFALLNLEFSFIQPQDDKEMNLKEEFDNYDINIDFGINSNDIIQVVINAEINRGVKKLSGYSIFAEAACLFEFNKKVEIPEETRNSIEGFSTIYIALNTLRGFISQVTANAPLGRYILPSIDLNDLISQKKKQFLENQAEKVVQEKHQRRMKRKASKE